MATILFARARDPSFIVLDRELLAERYEIVDWKPRRIGSPLAALRAVRRADAVFGWWAHWSTLWPVTMARLTGTPSVLVVGGFDTANEPDIGYGSQRGGVRRWVSRFIMRRATVLIANSEYIRGEVARNIAPVAEKVVVIHHGVPDPFGSLPEKGGEPLVVTVGVIDRDTIQRKGQLALAAAARLLPEASFALIGRASDEAVVELGAGENVEFPGFVSDEELHDWLRRAAVYAQPSVHEGFGVAVVEAMLAGCVPVVTRAGALPEVVGEAGVIVDSREPAILAEAIRRALDAGPEAAARARDRALAEFPLERRRQALFAAVEGVLS